MTETTPTTPERGVETVHEPLPRAVVAKTPTVFQALIAVRRAVGHVSKDSRNQQGSGYNFRGIDAIVTATTLPLLEAGVNIVPEAVVSCEQVDVKSGSKRTDMQATRLVIRFRVYGPAGDSFPIEAAGEAYDSGDKATPKASSVAWRTALLQALHIPTDEPDPDSFTYDRADESRHVQPPAPEPTPKQRAWKATAGAGDAAARQALLSDRLAKAGFDSNLGAHSDGSDTWTLVAVDLELNGFTVPGQPEPDPADAGVPNGDEQAGFPVSDQQQGEQF